MKFIYCDETNLDSRPDEFLIYAGLIVDADKAINLSNAIWKLRDEFGIGKESILKYLPAPKEISGDFTAFRKRCIALCIEHGCKLMTYQVLHPVAGDPDKARRNGINEICLNFSMILKREEQTGMILVDRFNDKGNEIDAHLRRKFSIGLEGLPHSASYPLDRVVGLHYTVVGQSHFTSLIDIILGSYRTAVNIYSKNETSKFWLAKEILDFLAPLFYRGDDDCIPRIAISFSPLEVRASSYRAKYAKLISNMNLSDYKLTQDYT